ncbi:hypothetical protein Avbf_00267 [Armadillidium vulgare]|nr:hypothetical protein Avbf_00267 [Armadillidium vulgare]
MVIRTGTMGTLKRKPKKTSQNLVRSSSDGGAEICESDEEILPPEHVDHPLTYTLYSYRNGVPTRATTIIDHPVSTADASSSIRHYCTLYPRKRRPKHTIASAFTVAPKPSTPVPSHPKELKNKTIVKESDSSITIPLPSPQQETSTNVQDSYDELVQFSPESPIDEPDDSEALINPYYFYARAALAHWHSKTATKHDNDSLSPLSKRYSLKGKTPKEKGSTGSKESSSSSSSTSIDQDSVDSIGLKTMTNVASLRVGGRSSGSAGASPEDTEQDSVKTTSKEVSKDVTSSSEKSNFKKPSQSSSDSSSEEIKTIMKPYEDVFEGSPITPLSPPISVDEPYIENCSFRHLLRKEEGEALLLDSSPSHGFFPPAHTKDFFAHSSPSPLFSDEEEVGGVIRPVHRDYPDRELSLLEEEEEEYISQPLETLIERDIEEENEPYQQEEYSYDPRKDPHLWPSLWKISGEIDEKIAAKVPTQPVSPCDSPSRPPHQPGLSDQKKQKLQEKSREILAQKQETGPHVAALRRSLDKEEEGDEEESSDEEDLRALQGRTTSSKGVEIDRASAGALKAFKI